MFAPDKILQVWDFTAYPEAVAGNKKTFEEGSTVSDFTVLTTRKPMTNPQY